MEATEEVSKQLDRLTDMLRLQNRHIGRLQMLKQILMLTEPVRHVLPPAYLAAVMRLDATEDPDGEA